jgi:hypothetical protein
MAQALSIHHFNSHEAQSANILLLYNIPHLVHIDQKQGVLELYQIDIVRKLCEKLPFSIDIMHECFHIPHQMDNLLILHNIDAQFTKIYDINVSPFSESISKNLPLCTQYACSHTTAELKEVIALEDNSHTVEEDKQRMSKYPIGPNITMNIVFDYHSEYDGSLACVSVGIDVPQLIDEENYKTSLNTEHQEISEINVYQESVFFMGQSLVIDLGAH